MFSMPQKGKNVNLVREDAPLLCGASAFNLRGEKRYGLRLNFPTGSKKAQKSGAMPRFFGNHAILFF